MNVLDWRHPDIDPTYKEPPPPAEVVGEDSDILKINSTLRYVYDDYTTGTTTYVTWSNTGTSLMYQGIPIISFGTATTISTGCLTSEDMNKMQQLRDNARLSYARTQVDREAIVENAKPGWGAYLGSALGALGIKR